MTFQDRAKDAIRASGGRVTPQRALLLDLLATAAADLDAETLHQRAAAHDPLISLPTVYRTLHTLEGAGLVSSHFTSSDHERKLYHVDTQTTRFHFTCQSCGVVIPFTSTLTDPLIETLNQQLGADVRSLCMCAGGLCAACREENDQ